MRKTKLVSLLKKLSSTELRKFHEYLLSPFFNKNQKLKQLGEIVLSDAPSFESEDLDKRKV